MSLLLIQHMLCELTCLPSPGNMGFSVETYNEVKSLCGRTAPQKCGFSDTFVKKQKKGNICTVVEELIQMDTCMHVSVFTFVLVP